MSAAAAKSLKSSPLISWKNTGKLQQTLINGVERSGRGLHSGEFSTVRILPADAGSGRYFVFRSNVIRASIDNAVKASGLCTTLSKDGYSVRTVEHLLSALEATSVDNCCIEIEGSNPGDQSIEVPIFDGSAKEWVEAIDQAGLKVAMDCSGKCCEKLAPYLKEPVHVLKNDSFVAAFPHSKVNITYGIDFPQAPAIGCQWFSSTLFDESFYFEQIASSRTFCLYEEEMALMTPVRAHTRAQAVIHMKIIAFDNCHRTIMRLGANLGKQRREKDWLKKKRRLKSIGIKCCIR